MNKILFGIAIGLLLAPKRGSDLMKDLKKAANDIVDNPEETKDVVVSKIDDLKEKVKDIDRVVVKETIDNIIDAVSEKADINSMKEFVKSYTSKDDDLYSDAE